MSGTSRSAAERLAALGLFALLAGCGESGPRANVLWLTVDTLRADHLGCYGYARDTSPNIDGLAEGGVLFERAYSTAPWTAPSITTMWTGLIPSAHGVTKPASVWPEGAPSIPGAFARAGYATGAVISNTPVSSKWGFDALFERFDENEAKGAEHVSSPGVAARTVELLREFADGGRPFFLYALFTDPHYIYHRQSGVEFAPTDGGLLEGGEDLGVLMDGLEDYGETEAEFLRGLYDEEVHFTDRGVGEVLDALEALGLADSTLVVLTADHGEELLERGWIGHLRTMYDELLRVPLVLRLPGALAPARVTEPVTLLELGPALLALAGVEPDAHSGNRLAALATGVDPTDAPAGAPIVGEVDFVFPGDLERTVRLDAYVRGPYKLIRDRKSDTRELYDLDADPLERRDLAASRPELVRELEAELEAAFAELRVVRYEPRHGRINAREMEQLRGLGYAGGD